MYFVLRIKSMEGVVVLLLSLLSCCLVASGNVVLIGNNVTMAFDDVEANFAPAIKGSGEHGVLYLAEPIDACSDLSNQAKKGSNRSSPFVLIIRGGCSFEDKVRRAQKAGYKAAIIYDNEEGILVAMAGNSAGVTIPAVFVSKTSGETLKKYAGLTDLELWIIPTFQNSAWSIMAIAFISLLAMAAVLATCFFVRRHHIRREHPRSSHAQEFHGMSRRVVKAMPSLAFTSPLEDNCTSTTCAICLEDYTVGEKLRILPCRHKFHAFCVDSWLTTWRTFCPVCKRDARTSTGEPPATESTPLLTSNPSSFASSSMLSSFRSGTSTAIQITPSRTPSVSHIPSHSSTPYVPQSSLRSYRHSPSITLSQRSADLRNMSSQRFHGSFLISSHSLGYPSISPHSLGYPSISPLNTRYMSSYITSPSNASPSLVSSYHQPRPLHCSESAASFSPFASAQSLPDC